MLSPRALPALPSRALVIGLAALVALALVPAAPASARELPAGEEMVRLVVRTESRSDTRDVAAEVRRDLAARGARPAGRVRKLRAVALDVPRSSAAYVAELLRRKDSVTRVDVAHQRWTTGVPSDPDFASQSAYLDAVRAPAAWDRSRGSANVRIAVIDTGSDVTHPDLAGKVAGTFNAVTGGSDVTDDDGHGTGVASIAAAATNNGVGLAGAGYDSTLLVAKVADFAGRIFTDDLAAAVVWAVDSRADVINLSLGADSADELERDAIEYAQRRGVLVVAAAGNTGTSVRQFPASLPGVLAVGATTTTGVKRASFSSYGGWVDVAAPGRGVVMAAPGATYATGEGTSFAAPLVAGQVALLEAYRPGRSVDELTRAIRSSTNGAELGFDQGLVDFNASLDLVTPSSVPVVTSPTAGATVSGATAVTVTSSAPMVELGLGDLRQRVPVRDGAASATFETFGLSGSRTVTAADCSRLGFCAEPTQVGVSVANPAPRLTSPQDGADASADAVTATAEATGGAVRFLVDGRAAATDLSPPFAVVLSTESLADGTHTIAAVSCRSDGTVCDTSGSAVSVRTTRLHPSISRLAPRQFSPGDDGRRDRTTLTYRLPSRQAVALRVRDEATGRVVRVQRLGTEPAGTHQVRWDGRVRGGGLAASGTYRMEISTRVGALRGLATRTVVVDREPPEARRPRKEGGHVYPVRDGYRDQILVTGRLTEPVRWIRVEARGRGQRIDGAKLRLAPEGTVEVPWNGRTAGGRPAPAGSYSVRLVAEDLAGNRSVSRALRVQVSGEQLVRRKGSVTVTARESLDTVLFDDCSLVSRLNDGKRRGWVAYFASGTCRSSTAYAVGEHTTRLPYAVRYGSIRISAYGGRHEPRYPDTARLTYFDRLQNLSRYSARLGSRLGHHAGPTVRADKLLYRHRVLRWATVTRNVAWYDVHSYTIRYTYFVLR